MNVFITTCSMNKAGGGKAYSCFNWENKDRSELLKIRYEVLELMRSGEIKSSMKLPLIGPDFGGRIENAAFLPAVKRYSQGAFVEGLKASGTRLTEWSKNNRLYFISGLYGLVHHQEPIQNYDLDLTQEKVQLVWKATRSLTRVLFSDLRWKSGEVVSIFDCCASLTYSGLIDWELLIKNGFTVRHAANSGLFTGCQVRWACGHLAGADPERLLDMLSYEESQYSSDNGNIRFLREMPPPFSGQKPSPPDSTSLEIVFNSVAVACLRGGQYNHFLAHARKHGWDKFALFEPIKDLTKATIDKYDQRGYKMLIIHVDESHAEVRRAYKVKSFDVVDNLPQDWQYRKVTNENYSDIQFVSRLAFKNE